MSLNEKILDVATFIVEHKDTKITRLKNINF